MILNVKTCLQQKKLEKIMHQLRSNQENRNHSEYLNRENLTRGIGYMGIQELIKTKRVSEVTELVTAVSSYHSQKNKVQEWGWGDKGKRWMVSELRILEEEPHAAGTYTAKKWLPLFLLIAQEFRKPAPGTWSQTLRRGIAQLQLSLLKGYHELVLRVCKKVRHGTELLQWD